MKQEAFALLRKAQDSLSEAKVLQEQGFYAFAASRAYYAMFYVAEALLLSMGETYSSHGGVIGAFGRKFAKTGKLDRKFHRWLIDAQDIRNIGDYGIDVDVTMEQADELIGQAAEFIQAGLDYLERPGGKHK